MKKSYRVYLEISEFKKNKLINGIGIDIGNEDFENIADAWKCIMILQAAPELLKSLKRVMATDGVRDDDKNRGSGTVYDEARAAIRLAEGINR